MDPQAPGRNCSNPGGQGQRLRLGKNFGTKKAPTTRQEVRGGLVPAFHCGDRSRRRNTRSPDRTLLPATGRTNLRKTPAASAYRNGRCTSKSWVQDGQDSS